jgi:hypothetical protein
MRTGVQLFLLGNRMGIQHSRLTGGQIVRDICVNKVDWSVKCQKINLMWNCFLERNTYNTKGALFLVLIRTRKFENAFFAWFFFLMCRNGTWVSQKPHQFFSTNCVQVKYTYIRMCCFINPNSQIGYKFGLLIIRGFRLSDCTLNAGHILIHSRENFVFSLRNYEIKIISLCLNTAPWRYMWAVEFHAMLI